MALFAAGPANRAVDSCIMLRVIRINDRRERSLPLGINISVPTNRQLALAARVVVALVGGYAFTWGFVALGIAGVTALGGDFHEVEMALLLLAFIVYLGLFLWAFTASGLMRVITVFGGGAVCMTACAWAVQSAVLG